MSGRIEGVEPGVIVLVSPRFINPAMRGCCAIVEECATWGVRAIVTGPAETRDEEGPLAYPVRLLWADIEATGGRLPPGWRFGDEGEESDD